MTKLNEKQTEILNSEYYQRLADETRIQRKKLESKIDNDKRMVEMLRNEEKQYKMKARGAVRFGNEKSFPNIFQEL